MKDSIQTRHAPPVLVMWRKDFLMSQWEIKSRGWILPLEDRASGYKVTYNGECGKLMGDTDAATDKLNALVRVFVKVAALDHRDGKGLCYGVEWRTGGY